MGVLIVTKMEDVIHGAMTERGVIRPEWRVKVTKTDNESGGDWATVHVEVYGPRCRIPYTVWELAVYVPKEQIHWDKSKYVCVNAPQKRAGRK